MCGTRWKCCNTMRVPIMHLGFAPCAGLAVRPAMMSRLRHSTGLLTMPRYGIADGRAWRHLSDRAGAPQTLVATVNSIQRDNENPVMMRGAGSAHGCAPNANWWRHDRDAHDDAHAAQIAVPLPQVRRPDASSSTPTSIQPGINYARRLAGAPAVTAWPETVASAGRRAGGREPARTHQSPAVQCAGMQWQSPFIIMRSV